MFLLSPFYFVASRKARRRTVRVAVQVAELRVRELLQQLADNTSEAIATSGEMYAKKFNVVASRELAANPHATDGAEQLRSLVELPVHEFSPSDDYCVSRSEGTGSASHQQCMRTRQTGIFAEDAVKVFPADRTVVQSAGTYHLHEPNGQRNRLSSVENAGAIDVAQLQAISIAAIQEQQRVIEEQQRLIEGLQRMGKEQQEMMAQLQADIDRLKPAAVP